MLKQKTKDLIKKDSDWIQPDIRVRIISRSFKGGNYYNKKAKIVDVVSTDRCSCKSEDNNILDDVHAKYLETVVPKTKGSYVMILHGKFEGMHAKLLNRNKVDCLASVQLPSNKHITTASFVYIAEFTGELPDDDIFEPSFLHKFYEFVFKCLYKMMHIVNAYSIL